MARDLPDDYSRAALFGPQRRHPYFEGAAERPFQPYATGFDPVNAWWLADASLLTYVPEEDIVREKLGTAGLEMTFYFDDGPRGFLAEGPEFTILAFRGTVFPDAHDFQADFDVRITAFPGGGRVHQGFFDSIRKILPELEPRVAAARSPVVATGHSLGAALAVLSAALLEPVTAVTTFGSPRIGDTVFGDRCRRPVWRVLNNNDLVGRIPPPGLFHHVGKLVYIDRKGRFHQEIRRRDRIVDSVAGQLDRGTDAVDAVVDHSPLHYAIHAANALPAL
ncbi:MAG: lipase family protein [Planctomycetota bacterium]